MKTEIYYFSDTGNLLFMARDITKRINRELTPIASVMGREIIKTNADVIGIVFPVYHAVFDGLALIVARFTGKLKNIEKKYVFKDADFILRK
jgi:hypothetical protein